MKPPLVILDCDGVLFDSSGSNIAFYNAILERMGCAALDEDGERMAHWMGSPELLAHLFGHDPARHELARAVAREVDYAPYLRLMQPVPQLFETLTWLRQDGATALATNRGATIPQLLDHFSLRTHFDLVVGLLDVARPKPAPDMLVRCLEHFGVTADDAVYVGDSPTDREAAHAAGIDFIAVGGAGEGRRIASLADLRTLLA